MWPLSWIETKTCTVQGNPTKVQKIIQSPIDILYPILFFWSKLPMGLKDQ